MGLFNKKCKIIWVLVCLFILYLLKSNLCEYCISSFGGFMEEILDCLDEDVLLEKFQKLYDDGDFSKCVTYIEKKLSAFSNKFYEVNQNIEKNEKYLFRKI